MPDASPSPWRGFWFLVGFSFRQQGRIKQMAGIALGLLLLSVFITAMVNSRSGWDRLKERLQRGDPRLNMIVSSTLTATTIDQSEPMQRIYTDSAPLTVFSRWLVFFLFLGFQLPLWSLAFGTAALGTDRENGALIWLMTRPLPKSMIYLATLLAVLPWAILFNVGGFGLICLAGGSVGREAFGMYWLAILGGAIGFTTFFHFLGAVMSRPAIVGLTYGFFFETILSELPVPGTLKRLSVNYYVRCLMYDDAAAKGIPVESESLFVPVSQTTAWLVLILGSALFAAVGTWIFTQRENRESV
jgi:ABC-2 type transport system permease protein